MFPLLFSITIPVGAASSVKRKSPAPLPQELAFLLKETTGQ